MRVIVVHPGVEYSVSDVWRGWCRGMREVGVEVKEFNLLQRFLFLDATGCPDDDKIEMANEPLLAAAYRWLPDAVIFVCAKFTPVEILDILRARGVKVVVIHTESPYEDSQQIQLAPHADINLLNDVVTVESWRHVNPETYYAPHSYDPTVHHPGKSAFSCDVSFIGTAWPERVAFLEQCDFTGIDLMLVGNWAESTQAAGGPLRALAATSPLRKHLQDGGNVDNDTTADIYRGSKCGLHVGRSTALRPDLAAGWSMGPREVEMAACGLFFPIEPRGENAEVFPFLPTFTEPSELIDIIRHYLADDDKRQELAERARDAIAGRTFANQASRLMARLSD